MSILNQSPSARSIDEHKLTPTRHQHSPDHRLIHSVLVHSIENLLDIHPGVLEAPKEHRRFSAISRSSSACSSSNSLSSLIDSYNNCPSYLPAITLSQSQDITPKRSRAHSETPLLSFPPENHHNMSTPSSLFPQKLSQQFRSRFIKSSKTASPLDSLKTTTTGPRPAPVKVPPSSVGLVIHPDSWAHLDDSDHEAEEEEEEEESDEPRELKERPSEDDDEVPLSQLRNKSGLIEATDNQSSEPHLLSKVIKRYRSSRSLKTLCKKAPVEPLPTTLPPSPPAHTSCPPPSIRGSQYQNNNNGNHNSIKEQRVSPPQAKPPVPIRTLRPAMSSPNLSQRGYSVRPGVGFLPFPPPASGNPAPLFHSSHQPFPSTHPVEFPTPPSSISPTARSIKLSSPQSSVSARSSERDLYRRMRRRHKEEINSLHSSSYHTSSASLGGGEQLNMNTPIDRNLFNMLNDHQRNALRQRSNVLGQNLKTHLEAFAYEMIHSNVLNHHQLHLNHQQSLNLNHQQQFHQQQQPHHQQPPQHLPPQHLPQQQHQHQHQQQQNYNCGLGAY
ncbi:hypothetical protein MJO28_016657 [Puccinia striiformis f. sp. tritici]|uniref:Uncharacterized protein n=2 Tax=Puccinia striiformis f. sp. tritici TaxID=168172 RepID=A0A0L0V829_9BASI|nr:hypothetical protein Pst134EA_030264 [Puccinia striiformis f. sp. tritici]KAH9446343.1 hypothetical protein Pst134EA_030264 [Puccinia striiformis f. sp. tritici]KAI7934722.1 hypothetical protein MJO29_015985 [Puccinia striiformis f. sp. tritici]KAI7935786.1 hypothetical protein MJO28_016657 [Puccinia striiformis f. sp. tritici]KNE95139.1 hypothetical protein PSTG_11507 [Puccinia striiformis f. sp. tritici PST-78]